jgi:hypothetical protein
MVVGYALKFTKMVGLGSGQGKTMFIISKILRIMRQHKKMRLDS